NNSQFIARFRLFPEAALNDGKVNMLYGRLKPRNQLLEDLGVLTQTYAFERARHVAARQVEVILAIPGTLMVDGDLISDVERVQFSVAPGRLGCCTRESRTRHSLDFRLGEDIDDQEIVADASPGRAGLLRA